mgnify:FL=1
MNNTRVSALINPLVAISAIALLLFCFANIQSEEPESLSITEAKARVSILESVYLSTLHNVHRKYFNSNTDRLPVPSRVLEDVFFSVDQQHGTKSRWIAVNAPAMNLEHKPKDGFEKRAAKELAKKTRYEELDNGIYYSARSITLFASCQKCHLSALAQQSSGRRVAGLVVSLPLMPNKPKEDTRKSK